MISVRDSWLQKSSLTIWNPELKIFKQKHQWTLALRKR